MKSLSSALSRTPRLHALFAGVALWAATPCAPQAADATSQYNLDRSKLALAGYDPVGYFVEGKAVKGRPELVVQHQGVTYQFTSDTDRELFRVAPQKYLPAYGGWCATAMAKGEKVEIDPTNFKVTDGRLFLFFKAFYANARKDWVKDEPTLTQKADVHWKKIGGE